MQVTYVHYYRMQRNVLLHSPLPLFMAMTKRWLPHQMGRDSLMPSQKLWQWGACIDRLNTCHGYDKHTFTFIFLFPFMFLYPLYPFYIFSFFVVDKGVSLCSYVFLNLGWENQTYVVLSYAWTKWFFFTWKVIILRSWTLKNDPFYLVRNRNDKLSKFLFLWTSLTRRVDFSLSFTLVINQFG